MLCHHCDHSATLNLGRLSRMGLGRHTLGEVAGRFRCSDCGARVKEDARMLVSIYEPLDQSPFHERVRWQPRLWKE